MSNRILVLDWNLFGCWYFPQKTTATAITTTINKTFLGLRKNSLSTRSYIYISSSFLFFSLFANNSSNNEIKHWHSLKVYSKKNRNMLFLQILIIKKSTKIVVTMNIVWIFQFKFRLGLLDTNNQKVLVWEIKCSMGSWIRFGVVEKYLHATGGCHDKKKLRLIIEAVCVVAAHSCLDGTM